MDDRKRLYALYASKNRLCALCENTTPELTAYNAYRNENRRVRRAEDTKMYAVGDAYRLHTSEYEHIRRVKERVLPSTSSLYCLFLRLLLSAIYGQSSFTACAFGRSRTPSSLIACFLQSRSAAIVTTCMFYRFVACMRCMHQKTDYACYAKTQLRKRLHTMHTETRIGVSVGLRA